MIRDLIKPRPSEPQDLLAQVPVEEAERTTGFYLSLALDVLTVAFAFWVGLLYQELLFGGGSLWNIALVATLFGVCLSLGLYLTKHALRRTIVLGVAIIGLFAFTFSPLTISFAGVAIPLALLLVLWGEALGRARIANSLHTRFFHGAQPLLAKTATALIVGGLILYIPFWTPDRAFFSKQVFESTFQAAAAATHRFYGEVDLTGTLGTFAASLARYRLLGAADFRRLPPVEQERVTREMTATIQTQLYASLQVGPSEERTAMSAIFYKLALRTFGDFEKQFGSWFLGIWLITVFFAFRAVGIVLSWIAGLVGYLFFQLLLVAKIIRFRGETETQEVVEYV